MRPWKVAAGAKGTEGRAPWSGIIVPKAHRNAGETNGSMLSLTVISKDIFLAKFY